MADEEDLYTGAVSPEPAPEPAPSDGPTDLEIAKSLNVPAVDNIQYVERIAKAAKRIHGIVHVWPQVWAAEFPPKDNTWGITLVEELSALMKRYDTGKLKDHLFQQAAKRDSDAPQLRLKDVRNVKKCLEMKGNNEAATTEDDHNDDEDNQAPIPVMLLDTNKGPAKRDDSIRRSDVHKNTNDMTANETDENILDLNKPCPPSSSTYRPSTSRKPSEADAMTEDAPMDLDQSASPHPSHKLRTKRKGATHSVEEKMRVAAIENEARWYNQLTSHLTSLEAAQTEMRNLEKNLSEAITDNTYAKKIDDLYVQLTEAKNNKTSVEDGKRHFENNLAQMFLDKDTIDQALQNYNARLAEQEQIINQTGIEIQGYEEIAVAQAKEKKSLQDQVHEQWKIIHRLQELRNRSSKENEFWNTIASLFIIKADGVTRLKSILESKGVSMRGVLDELVDEFESSDEEEEDPSEEVIVASGPQE